MSNVSGIKLQESIDRQREMLTDLLTISMYKSARRLAPLMSNRYALEMLLVDEVRSMRFCKYLYVLDAGGTQVTSNVTREGVDRSQFARNRSYRNYMQDIVGTTDFRLSRAYISKNTNRPSMTAIQVIRDNSGKRVGFLGADYDLRELPLTQRPYSETSEWRQLTDDPAIRKNLFQQQRHESIIDRRIGDVLILMHELITVHGVYHGKIHFSSNRATIWLTEDPHRYRLLGIQELIDPDICLAYPRQPYPDTALVPVDSVMLVLDHFRTLRFGDDSIYLRSGSLNIFNGQVGLNFSCDGSHYMDFREFLEKDMDFWYGMTCAV